MTRSARCTTALTALLVLIAPARALAQDDGYARSSSGIRELTLGSGTVIKMFLDASNLGGSEVEVAEITFPAGAPPGGAHRHGSIEIFYVVSGIMGHVVNGVEHRLEPGMVGVVRPEDQIAHRVIGDEPVKAVVLWVPGGESDRIAPPDRWRRIGG